jgi:hypothetical protein
MIAPTLFRLFGLRRKLASLYSKDRCPSSSRWADNGPKETPSVHLGLYGERSRLSWGLASDSGQSYPSSRMISRMAEGGIMPRGTCRPLAFSQRLTVLRLTPSQAASSVLVRGNKDIVF